MRRGGREGESAVQFHSGKSDREIEARPLLREPIAEEIFVQTLCFHFLKLGAEQDRARARSKRNLELRVAAIMQNDPRIKVLQWSREDLLGSPHACLHVLGGGCVKAI